MVGICVAGGAAWWYQNRVDGVPMLKPAAQRDAPAGRGRGGGGGGPQAVEVARVVTASVVDDAQAVGSLRSRQGVMLRPEVSGRITRLDFKDGQRVRRGQLLVQLDDSLPAAQLQQAQAQARIARTHLQRNRELVAQNFVSTSVVDQAAANLQVAEAQVALAQAQLARTRIRAPFDGVAGIRHVDLGAYVQDGADLVSVEDLSSVSVDFRLAERYVSRLRPGQAVAVRVDALPGKTFTGQVDAVDAILDADGRSLLVRARLPNAGGELRSGMFARASIVFAVRDKALVVPEEALVPQGGKQFLVKVVEGPQGHTSQRIEARIGARLPGQVEILGGLAEGDVIVTAGQARLLTPEGLPVRIVNGTASRAAPAASGAASAPRAAAVPA